LLSYRSLRVPVKAWWKRTV